MRVIYLTLAFFVLLGIGATCRTPPLLSGECTPGNGANPANIDCPDVRGSGD